MSSLSDTGIPPPLLQGQGGSGSAGFGLGPAGAGKSGSAAFSGSTWQGNAGVAAPSTASLQQRLKGLGLAGVMAYGD